MRPMCRRSPLGEVDTPEAQPFLDVAQRADALGVEADEGVAFGPGARGADGPAAHRTVEGGGRLLAQPVEMAVEHGDVRVLGGDLLGPRRVRCGAGLGLSADDRSP